LSFIRTRQTAGLALLAVLAVLIRGLRHGRSGPPRRACGAV